MAKLVVVAAEGVICRRDGQNAFRANQPIGPGMDLIASFNGIYNIAVVTAEDDPKVVQRWLTDHGLRQHYSYLVERKVTMPEEPAQRFLAQCRLLRSQGFAIGMVVVSDPAMAAAAHAEGYTCLLFTHPQYARPEWRPDDDRGMRAWADIEEDMATQARLKAGQSEESDGRFEEAVSS